MSLTLQLESRNIHEQIKLLRGLAANPRLSERQRFLINDLLQLLHALGREVAGEDAMPTVDGEGLAEAAATEPRFRTFEYHAVPIAS